jgi:hypothetical protein
VVSPAQRLLALFLQFIALLFLAAGLFSVSFSQAQTKARHLRVMESMHFAVRTQPLQGALRGNWFLSYEHFWNQTYLSDYPVSLCIDVGLTDYDRLFHRNVISNKAFHRSYGNASVNNRYLNSHYLGLSIKAYYEPRYKGKVGWANFVGLMAVSRRLIWESDWAMTTPQLSPNGEMACQADTVTFPGRVQQVQLFIIGGRTYVFTSGLQIELSVGIGSGYNWIQAYEGPFRLSLNAPLPYCQEAYFIHLPYGQIYSRFGIAIDWTKFRI